MVKTDGTWQAAGMAIYCGDIKVAQCLDEDSPEIWGAVAPEHGKYPSEDQGFGNAKHIARCVNTFSDMHTVLTELVRLWDAGLRPQIVKGGLREEHDFAELVIVARSILNSAQIKETADNTNRKTAFAVVRKDVDSGKEYIDIASIECLPEMAKADADKADRTLPPNWSKANPFQRTIQIQITEIRD
jgi:hypothetical protein